MRDLLAKVLAEPEKYQGIIAGTIAFVGVILALFGNALLAWLDRWSKRRHDARVVRSALVAELQFLVNSYEYREQLMASAGDYFDVPRHTATEVYDKLLDRFGLLSSEQGHAVIHAYLAAKHLPMNLRRNEKEREIIDFSDRHEGFVRVSRQNIPHARLLHRERIDFFKKAIAALNA